MTPSRLASDAARIERRRLALLTPDERVALVLRLSEEGLLAFMAAHGVDRRTALSRIAATRRVGRPRSASAEAQ